MEPSWTGIFLACRTMKSPLFTSTGLLQRGLRKASACGSTPTISAEGESDWAIGPADYAKTGGFTRLDLTALVADWASGESENYGVVVSTDAVSAEALLSQASEARLVVLYTFRK